MEDFIYDDLSEMSDLTTTPNNAESTSSLGNSVSMTSIPTSSSVSTESVPLLSLTIGNSVKDDQSTSHSTSTSCKKCICRGSK